jgi:hypothetical protein
MTAYYMDKGLRRPHSPSNATYLAQLKKNFSGGLVEHLPSKREALRSNRSTNIKPNGNRKTSRCSLVKANKKLAIGVRK